MRSVTVRFGACVLDAERRELRRGGEPVHLSPKAFELLLALLESRPRPLSKADLHRRLWPSTFVHEANLRQRRLRASRRDRRRCPPAALRAHRSRLRLRVLRTGGGGRARAAESSEGHPFLYCLQGEAGIATLVEGDHLLGRGHESAIYLSAPSVSRRHARLQIARGEAMIEDLGSRHGTFVRGERLTGPHRLDDGDEFCLGVVRLTFRVLRAADLSGTR